MASDMKLDRLFAQPPKDAIDYFNSKGLLLSWDWQEVSTQAHAHAFTVAKLAQLDVLTLIQTELKSALTDGISGRDFINSLAPKLKSKGWWGKKLIPDGHGGFDLIQEGSAWRLNTIYKTNMSTAYMSGRYKAMLENSDHRPYWQYIAIDDGRTRESHRALDGKVFRYDDPIWDTLYPPNGWGCRCRVRALTEKQLQQKGLSVERSDGLLSTRRVNTGVNKQTGEQYQSDVTSYKNPNGETLTPDPAWSNNVGQSAFGSDMLLLRKLSEIQSSELREQIIQSLNGNPLRQQVWADWVIKTLEHRRAGKQVQTLGFVSESISSKLAQKGVELPERIMVMGEKHLVHADSQRHQESGLTLTAEEYEKLPLMVATPEAVLWDKSHQNLLYIYPSTNEQKIKIVVNAPYKLKGVKDKLDVAINTFKVELRNLLDDNYELLEGEISASDGS